MNGRAVAVARFGTTAEASATALEPGQGAAGEFLKGPVVGICLGAGFFQRGRVSPRTLSSLGAKT